jgi:hypothetical protein
MTYTIFHGLHFLCPLTPPPPQNWNVFRFDVLTGVNIKRTIFWDVMPYNYWCFGGKFCFHLQNIRVICFFIELEVSFMCSQKVHNWTVLWTRRIHSTCSHSSLRTFALILSCHYHKLNPTSRTKFWHFSKEFYLFILRLTTLLVDHMASDGGTIHVWLTEN